MEKKTKIFITIFFIALVGLGTYAFNVYQQRNSVPNVGTESGDANSSDKVSDSQRTASEEFLTENESPNSAVDEPSSSSDEPEEVSNLDSNGDEKTNYLDVSKSDCNDDCKSFSDPDDLKYCREICGIDADKKDSKNTNGCDALEDLEKDYCLKDLAISKNDIGICTKIEDSNIEKTCKNRIAQDLIEGR